LDGRLDALVARAAGCRQARAEALVGDRGRARRSARFRLPGGTLRPDRLDVSSVTATASPAQPLQPGVLATGKLDVAGYLQQWLAHARGRVRAVTYEGYEVLLRRHALPRLGQLQLEELSPLAIQNLYSELLAGSGESDALSAGTVLNLRLVLN